MVEFCGDARVVEFDARIPAGTQKPFLFSGEQLFDRRFAVSNDIKWDPLVCRDNLSIQNHDSIIPSAYKILHKRDAIILKYIFQRALKFLHIEYEGYVFSLTAAIWFGDERKAAALAIAKRRLRIFS